MYIRKLEIKNYRSLKDFSIGSLNEFVVLYGHNDTGKSNVLFFLETLFKPKFIEETINTHDSPEVLRIPTGFWRGEIEDFSDNFFKNKLDPVTFSILISIERDKIKSISGIPKKFIDTLPLNKKYDMLTIEGKIEPTDDVDRGKMILTKVLLNKKVFLNINKSGNVEYLPGYKIEDELKHNIFERIMGKLDNAFLRIPNNRFLTVETETNRKINAEFSPNSFKNWLFQNSIDREGEKLFLKICSRFNSKPFEHGRISIARTHDDKIEVFVEDKHGLKLPVGRKGTGVQQILIILSYIEKSNSPFVGIEEIEINLSPQSQHEIFQTLYDLIFTVKKSPINQVFLTTHSPQIARQKQVQQRGVWMDEQGGSKAAKPSEANENLPTFFKLR